MKASGTRDSDGFRGMFAEGVRLHESGRPDEALSLYMAALEINPADTGILGNIAVALHDCGRLSEAVEIYNHLLALVPHSGVVWHNRGNSLLAMERLQESIDSYGRAVGLMPDSAESLVPMGTALERMRRYEEALEAYQDALRRDPGSAEAHWNMALLDLLMGNYKDGWREFRWRWQKKGYPTAVRNFGCPEWHGELFAGKTLLIHAEQGFGDTIQFARFIPMVAELGGKLVLEVPRPLVGLFQKMTGVTTVPTGVRLPALDLHVPLLSLPGIFGTTLKNIPAMFPYLAAPECHQHKWHMLLPGSSRLKVGIVWKGRNRPDPARSCPCELLDIFSGLENIDFYSLQLSEDSRPVEKPDGLPLIDLTSWIHDFSDTAALIERMDLVISIDTSVVHLAGSLGCAPWVLLPFAADWRWTLQRDETPWYPGARLFRQIEPGGWQELLQRVRAELVGWSFGAVRKADTVLAIADSGNRVSLRFCSYIFGKDYYLATQHEGREVPLPQASGDMTEGADYYILNKDLCRLQNNLGSDGVCNFINGLPYYQSYPARHVFWSSHDNQLAPDETAIFCKASASLFEKGRIIAVPYLVEDLAAYVHFDTDRICWHTCFVGFPGSSAVRERMLLSVAGNHVISAKIDIAPKFHSHLDIETRNRRRQIYLETMAQSLTVLCPRGDGMSSIRFFEALSIGRIPVLIADGCALPFDYFIPYDRFIIRIAEADAEVSGALVGKWIAGKSPGELLARCREARNAWERWLSPIGIADCIKKFLMVLNAADSAEYSVEYGNGEQSAALGIASSAQEMLPTVKETALHLGLRHYEEGQFVQAEFCFKKAIVEEADSGEAVSCLALLLNEQGRFEETIHLLAGDAGSGCATDVPELTRILGEAYQSAGMATDAYDQYLRATQSFPDDPRLLMNMGVVCDALDRQVEALSYLTGAREITPDNPQIALNLGGVLQSMNRLDDAEICYREALRLDPDYATAVWNLAQLLLLKGSYPEGFRLFEARFTKSDPVSGAGLDLPFWHGEPVCGSTMVVTTEQAFGDAIQFSRYLTLLADQGVRVILLNHLKPLQALLESLRGVFAVIDDPELLPHADFQIPMLSLPRLFGTTIDTIPADVPYMRPSPIKARMWQEKLSQVSGLRVGIVWAGRQLPDPRRSAALKDFAPLVGLNGVQLISLQIGAGSEEILQPPPGMNILDVTSHIESFEDTAALIENLDLVISVDTSVAHLAGALGKPVWLLLPFAPDWRWSAIGDRCPWYPTMLLFRQNNRNDWRKPIEHQRHMLSYMRKQKP